MHFSLQPPGWSLTVFGHVIGCCSVPSPDQQPRARREERLFFFFHLGWGVQKEIRTCRMDCALTNTDKTYSGQVRTTFTTPDRQAACGKSSLCVCVMGNRARHSSYSAGQSMHLCLQTQNAAVRFLTTPPFITQPYCRCVWLRARFANHLLSSLIPSGTQSVCDSINSL